jgi:4-amino-4-deoxy-L-arabinose transferase-like glycosyltransferase
MNQERTPALAGGAGVNESKHALPRARWCHRVALGAIMLGAIALHFARLDQEGFANLYYAATVKSMLMNWHNFFFASFDPGGFVTVDKPPLGFWVQAASAFIFGFSGVSLLLPQALAGVLSVALLYHLVARVFGATAGLIAALVLAVTPISIAANRNNTMDSQLVFTSLLAVWAVSIAIEKGKLRWLLVCAILVGVGFNIKMLQAYMVLPAFWLTYFIAARTRWYWRIAHLTLATVVLLVVSFAWVVIVDLTPPDERPYIGSSHNNTVTELIVGHNGLARLGQIASWIGAPAPGVPRPLARPGELRSNSPGPLPVQPAQPPGYLPPNSPGQLPRTSRAPAQPAPPAGAPPPNQPGLPANPPPNSPNAPPMQSETGAPGILRLFNQQLAGQISWFLPLALFCALAAALATRLHYPFTREHQQLLLWFAWLSPQIVFFSFAGLFHRYYLEMMAPAIAALVGAGLGTLWRDYACGHWRGWLLPIAILVGAATQAAILLHFAAWVAWLIPVVAIFGVLVALALTTLRLFNRAGGGLPSAVIVLGILALLIAPTLWSVTPLFGADTGLPFAGPELLARSPRPSTPPRDRLIDYLVANRGSAQFLVATINANSAAPIILATGEPAMALGGFSGSDPILKPDELAQLVANDTVRYFWLNAQPNQQAELTRWVVENCAPVLPQTQPNAPRTSREMLYDCGRAKSKP